MFSNKILREGRLVIAAGLALSLIPVGTMTAFATDDEDAPVANYQQQPNEPAPTDQVDGVQDADEPTDAATTPQPEGQDDSATVEERGQMVDASTQTDDEELTQFPWLDTSKSDEERADLLIAAMNEEQLVHMLHGNSNLLGGRIGNDGNPPSIGYIDAIPELRVPALILTDGPVGLRNWEPATQFPAPIMQASSFDRNMMNEIGANIGMDAKDRGQDVLFGPGFNLARNPRAGRTFEYMGEDPYLSGTLAAAYVNGLQDQGVMATIKHYVANNQETNRTLSNSVMDQRTLHEIYERPFDIALQHSDPASVMCAYNKINGVYACSNYQTMVTDLRGRMGFDGFVVSDYPATHKVTDIKNGLNVELPSGIETTVRAVRRAIERGEMTWDDVKVRVKETLVQMFRFGLFDHPWDEAKGDRERPLSEIPVDRGYNVALKAAEAGAVLMKNDGILPLKDSEWDGKRILIVGSGAKEAAAGGGSSAVISIKKDNFLDEFKARVPNSTVVWKSEWDPLGIKKEAGAADLVIVVAKTISTELFDRLNLDFFPHMNNAVKAATRANPNTIVVMQVPGPVLMPWKQDTRAVLNMWYPGAAGGKATTNLLFGDVNPSGRLPQTFPVYNSQVPASQTRQFPGAKLGFESHYDEGVFMGYRWYDQKQETPAFCFGYGLSYTTFAYSNATISANSGGKTDALSVTFTVTNTGDRAGAVSPQVYVGKPGSAAIPTPPKELANYTKVYLQPGQSQQVTLEISPDQLSVFDTSAMGGQGDFVVPTGNYRVYVADNANAIKATFNYQVN